MTTPLAPPFDFEHFLLKKGDAFDLIKALPDNSGDASIGDPPYNLHKMGSDWDHDALTDKSGRTGVVKSLPGGMKLDREQGRQLGAFMFEMCKQTLRVLKPGAFYINFSQPRLSHWMAVAMEDAGFEIRDILIWNYGTGQTKAASQDRVVRKMKISDEEKVRLLASMGGRKTPQLRPMCEHMILAQKPREGTFVQNWDKWGVGLVDTTQSLDGKFPGQIMSVAKPSKEERGVGNDHVSVKPVKLIGHLIELVTTEGQVVIDPFAGSGSHGVAAMNTGRKFIGFEREPRAFNVAANRLLAAAPKPTGGGGTCGQGPKRSFDVAKFKLPPEQPRSFGFGWAHRQCPTLTAWDD